MVELVSLDVVWVFDGSGPLTFDETCWVWNSIQ